MNPTQPTNEPVNPAAKPALIQPDSTRNIIGALVLVALIVVGSGLVHFLYGGQAGCSVIAKEDWALHDTFVNMDEIESMSFFEAVADGHRSLLRALVRSEVIRNPLDR